MHLVPTIRHFALPLFILGVSGCTPAGSGSIDDTPLAAKATMALFGRFVSGPVYSGPVPPASGNGVLYIYRPVTWPASSGAPHVYINMEKQHQLLTGGYQRYELASGRYHIVTEGSLLLGWPGKDEVTIDLEAGKVEYLRLTTHTTGFDSGVDARLKHVNDGMGAVEIRQTKLSN